MSRRPNAPLDADERAIAALLPRPHGRTEPGSDLDARILAAAHAAATPSGPASKRPSVRQRRWLLPASVAATVALAAGLSWQLLPPAMHPTESTSAASSAPQPEGDGTMSVRMIERRVVAPPPPPPPLVQAPPSRGIAPASPPPSVVAPPTEPARQTLDHFDDEATGTLAAEPASPQPAEQSTEAARAPAPAMAKAMEGDTLGRESGSIAGNTAAQAQDSAQRADADAATLDTVTIVEAGEPEDDVPPATADSPEVRAAWLRRIGELVKQGKAGEAKASLDEFRRRYPDAAIPVELRKLED